MTNLDNYYNPTSVPEDARLPDEDKAELKRKIGVPLYGSLSEREKRHLIKHSVIVTKHYERTTNRQTRWN